jgi:Domain of unknown function (DUF6285)
MNDRPNAIELVAAVEEFLNTSVVPAVDSRLRFEARVAANLLAVVGRELQDDPAEHVERLAALGCDGEDDVAARIRSGAFDDHPALAEVLQRLAERKVRIVNPQYLAAQGGK